MRFGEPFWRSAGLAHMIIFPRDPGDPAVWVIGQDAFGGGPVLLFQIFHSAARRVLGAPEGETVRWALRSLTEVVGGPVPEPTAVAVTSWANDPVFRGRLHPYPPGSPALDADLLGEPVGGRLLFAWEHTQSARLAYADGAMSSGTREAQRLLGRPAVHLGPVIATPWPGRSPD